jgi:hypothetical protein
VGKHNVLPIVGVGVFVLWNRTTIVFGSTYTSGKMQISDNRIKGNFR